MNIKTYYRAHAAIVREINTLRKLSGNSAADNAHEIAQIIAAMAGQTKYHLASEDRMLYPALSNSDNPGLAAMGKRYQKEMQGLAEAFESFVEKWQVSDNVAADPDGFRHDANVVLKALFDRIHRENTELYPAAEKLIGTTEILH